MSTLRANLQSTVSMPRRLARDERGNVVWIMAFALIPLIGLVGAGIDMTRAYMANTRLQAACDSGVLAGRKDMAGVEYTAANQQTALDHFTVNYGPNEFRSSNVSFESERLPSGEVTGKATASMPTAIMHIMGRDTIELSATCGARMDLTNADIVFVLDTTGSMNQMAGKMTRIEGLRAAVTNFTDVLNKSNNSNRRIRYGFVPYSSSVNVGGLLKPAWLANKWTYQSRRVGETLIQEGYNSATANFKYVSGTIEWIRTPMLPETCIPPANKMNWNEELVSEVKSELPDGRKVITQYRKTTSNGSVFTIEREKDNNGKVTQCYVVEQKRTDYVETFTRTFTERTPEEKIQVKWDYLPIEYDVSSLKTPGATISLPIGSKGAQRTLTWNGCIEERATSRTPIGSDGKFTPEAIDLNIELVPNADPATKWGPALGGAVFARNWRVGTGGPADANWRYEPQLKVPDDFVNLADWDNGDLVSCPTAARNLAVMEQDAVVTYVGGLTTQGYTHPDIGMLWGARLIWPTGLFGDLNSNEQDGPVSRNIVFMTDDETKTLKQEYDAYGISALDRRRTPTDTLPSDPDQDALVNARLAAICDAAKNRGITIWVVAFGTNLTSSLEKCASTGRAFKADDDETLNATFQDIAAKIGNLRVTR